MALCVGFACGKTNDTGNNGNSNNGNSNNGSELQELQANYDEYKRKSESGMQALKAELSEAKKEKEAAELKVNTNNTDKAKNNLLIEQKEEEIKNLRGKTNDRETKISNHTAISTEKSRLVNEKKSIFEDELENNGSQGFNANELNSEDNIEATGKDINNFVSQKSEEQNTESNPKFLIP